MAVAPDPQEICSRAKDERDRRLAMTLLERGLLLITLTHTAQVKSA